ncbi:MAG TPA: AraC family transcriptional regulator [Puia sp.]|jgi:AraC-like DNA-binding protein|nr:AraC family transcriptional regulator [Puia sp.]
MEAPAYHHLETDTGTRDSATWEVDGIRMGHAISKFRTLTEFTSTGATSDVVRLHIGLRGNYSFQHRQLDTTFDLIGGHHNLLYSKDFEMTVHNRTLELETFGVQFPRETFLNFTANATDLLKRFSERIINNQPVILTDDWGAVDPAIHQVIDQIIHHRYTGDLQRLFLLSKSIELLVCCAESCEQAQQTGKTRPRFLKSNTDKEKIIAARDLVNARIDSPPSLSEISRTVGLNEYKLKRGFKETFATTVFGYLTAQRLHLARRYLLDTQKTAAEIAFELGYATPQHFNNAFKKHFGHTPQSVRKNP